MVQLHGHSVHIEIEVVFVIAAVAIVVAKIFTAECGGFFIGGFAYIEIYVSGMAHLGLTVIAGCTLTFEQDAVNAVLLKK